MEQPDMPASPYHQKLREHIGHEVIYSPGTAAIIWNEVGEILLQRRSDDGQWGLPGGACEPGEEPAEAVVREVFEETGLQVIPVSLVGIFGGQDGFHEYPNGDQMMFLGMVFVCRLVGGALTLDEDETLELRYFPLDQLPASLFSRHGMFIEQASHHATVTAFRYKGKFYPG
jgi:mutator protein MutT